METVKITVTRLDAVTGQEVIVTGGQGWRHITERDMAAGEQRCQGLVEAFLDAFTGHPERAPHHD